MPSLSEYLEEFKRQAATYNPVRRQSRLDNLSPVVFEENLTTRNTQIEASA